jgi:hypothetical protein
MPLCCIACKPRAQAQSGRPDNQAKATPRNTDTEYKAGKLACRRIEASSLVLTLLIQITLRWLLPVTPGIGSPAVRVIPTRRAIKHIANQHHIGLAPFHAPPLWLPG